MKIHIFELRKKLSSAVQIYEFSYIHYHSSISCVNFSHHSAVYANLAIIRLGNYLRVFGERRTEFSKYSVSGSPIITYPSLDHIVSLLNHLANQNKDQ